jgi:hypothetical protein
MASFIHLTDARDMKKMLRGGLRAERSADGDRGVFCVPVVPNFQTTFQWLRELKRRGYRTAIAIQFRLPDIEVVRVGRYAQPHAEMTAAEAAAFFLAAPDPRGLEVIVPRSIKASEIAAVRAVPQLVGWRYFPEAKGKPPYWPQPGSFNASYTGRAVDKRYGG